jgi:hypothetical protein
VSIFLLTVPARSCTPNSQAERAGTRVQSEKKERGREGGEEGGREGGKQGITFNTPS